MQRRILPLLLVSASLSFAEEERPLLAPLSGTWTSFGTSVAVDGDWAIVGSPRSDDYGADAGMAYVFDLDTLALQVSLGPGSQTPGTQPYFGGAVDLDMPLAIVGADGVGEAVLFHGITGQELARFSQPVGTGFGGAVAVSGSLVAVGAPNDEGGRGAVYVYDVISGQQIARLTLPGHVIGESLGRAVTFQDGQVIASAWSSSDPGSVHLFDAISGAYDQGWFASDASSGDLFGSSLSASGGRLLVGAPGKNTATGGAYLYDQSTGTELAILEEPGEGYVKDYGLSVALDGDRALVGAPRHNEVAIIAGLVFHYDLSNPGHPVELQRMRSASTTAYDRFGSAVALEGDRYVIGSPWDDLLGANSGSAWLFGAQEPLGSTLACPAVANSTGSVAELAAFGSPNLALGELRLDASGLPPGQAALLVSSTLTGGPVTPPGSQGNLCLSGAIGRHHPALSTGFGFAQVHVDPTYMPAPSGPVAWLPGETWNFQLWYRDQNPGSTSNFTDTRAIQLQ